MRGRCYEDRVVWAQCTDWGSARSRVACEGGRQALGVDASHQGEDVHGLSGQGVRGKVEAKWVVGGGRRGWCGVEIDGGHRGRHLLIRHTVRSVSSSEFKDVTAVST